MSTLSQTQLKSIVKKYVENFINDFELEQATSKHFNPSTHDDLLNGYDWALSESHDALANRNHVREMSGDVDTILTEMGISLNKSSDDYQLVSYSLLKARIRALQACKSRLEHRLHGHTIDDILMTGHKGKPLSPVDIY